MSGPAPAIPGGKVVAWWLCRGGCGTLVDVTEAGVEAMVVFNGYLRRNGEKPLDTAKIVACDHCRAVEERRYQERAAAAREEIQRICDELRQCESDTEHERALIRDLHQLGCDDAHEIAAAIRDSKNR